MHAFGALVREKWREWDEGRGKAAAARKHKERERQKASAALLVRGGAERAREGLPYSS